MKKNTWLSLILVLALVLSCLPVHTFADDPTQPADTATDATQAPLDLAQQTQAPQTDYAFGSVCILNGCRTLEAQVPLAGSDRRLESAQSALVYEQTTGTMIYAYNPDMKLSPGSLVKLVTALLVVERVEDLDIVVTVGAGIASRVPGGAQTIQLKSEEQLTVNDLLHCMIMQNASDAAVALAEFVAGNQSSFVELMNARLKQMGCTGTEFGNVHGFDNVSQYTTARDMARIMIEASKNERMVELLACQSYTVPETNTSEERKFASQNYLMETTIVPKYNDRRVTGGLASYSASSGASIVCTADSTTEKKQGLNLVCVILGANRQFRENGWSVINYGNFDEMIDLLEFSYNNFKVNRVLYDGMAFSQIPVSGGTNDAVGMCKLDMDSVLPADAQMANLIREQKVRDGGLAAPIAKGDMVATIELWYRSSCLLEAELYAQEAVKATSDNGLTVYSALSQSDSRDAGFTRVILIVCAALLVPMLSYLAINAYLRSRYRARRRRRRQARRRSR